ncbi:MAG: GntR family transcriptional regulator [Thermodesulfobacteriota bacterium]
MINRTDVGTLHRTLTDSFRSYILQGTWSVGGLIPSEQELCARFSTSRTTVRKALENLALEGYIQRRPGKGTWVREFENAREIWRVAGITADYPFPEHVRTEILSSEHVPADSTDPLFQGFQNGEILAKLRVLRSLKGTPLALADIYLQSQDGERVMKSFRSGEDIYLFTVLERETGRRAKEVHDTIDCRLAIGDVARLLNVADGMPLLFMTRLLLDDDGSPVESVRTYFRPDLHRVRIVRVRETMPNVKGGRP